MAFDTNDPQHPVQPFLRQTPQPSSDSHRPEALPTARAADAAWRSGSAKSLDDGVVKRINQWPTFVALAVQIDLPDSNEVTGELHETLVSILKSSVKKYKGIWFHWKGPLYSCALPQFTVDQARDAAMAIQHKLVSKRQETVTIGLAQYPLLTYSRAQTLSNACKALDHAAFFGPGATAVFNAVSLNISGDRFYQNRRLKAAVSEYENALRLDAQDINVHNSLGVCRAELKQYAKARKCFRTVLDLEPGETMATYNLGVVHLLQDDLEQALALFKEAYERNTSFFEIPYQIGKVLVDQKNYAKAKPYLDRAVLLRADSSNALRLIGQCLAEENKIPEAIKTLKKAVKINPNDAAALSELGCLYDKKGENPDICLTFSRQSVALAPRDGKFRFRLARLYQKYGQTDLALKEYDEAVALGYPCPKPFEELDGNAGDDKPRSSRYA